MHEERRKNFITAVRLDILQFNIVTMHKYILYTCVLHYIRNISELLDFRPTPMYNRNYHNDTKRAITTNYISVSNRKFPYYITENFFQLRFVIPVLVVKYEVLCPGRNLYRNSGEK